MVVEIISHIMPSIEDSLNVTVGCALAVNVNTGLPTNSTTLREFLA
jgi:hypothetical protein